MKERPQPIDGDGSKIKEAKWRRDREGFAATQGQRQGSMMNNFLSLVASTATLMTCLLETKKIVKS